MQKRNGFMRLAALFIIAALALGCVSAFAAERATNAEAAENIAPHRFQYISTCWNNFQIGAGWKATCEGETIVSPGYLAGVMLEVQQDVGYWKTIKSWEHSDAEYMYIGETVTLTSGYKYRLKTTHTAYDSNWNVLEENIMYSNVKP